MGSGPSAPKPGESARATGGGGSTGALKFCVQRWTVRASAGCLGELTVTYSLFALPVHFLERVLPRPLCLESLVVLVELQSSPGVLNRIVRVGLDTRVQHGVRQEPQRELSLPLRQVVDVDGIDDLRRRDVDVCAEKGEPRHRSGSPS